jgi:peptidoglycan/xylan/chitin deacetylase (PgdA/CDA1 family)
MLSADSITELRAASDATTESVPAAYLTISIDDGHPADFKTIELLQKYGLTASFYIPVNNPERPVISPAEIRQIAQHFEIGAHTMNNVRLKWLSERRAWVEITESKKWLEDVIGSEVTSFCYPGGKFTYRLAGMVRDAGYLGARTCMFNRTDFPTNPFVWGVTTHACSHSVYMQTRHALFEGNLAGARNFFTVSNCLTDWKRQFLCTLDHVRRQGGIAHLYMHSWEIEQNGDWVRLESVFKTVSNHAHLIRSTNGELFRLWHEMKKSTTTPDNRVA